MTVNKRGDLFSNTMGKAPAFQFYAADFITDTLDWTDEQVGAHVRLLAWSWVNRRGIPRDFDRMCRIAKSAKKAWPVIGDKWKEGPDGTWTNGKLELTRADSDAFRAKQKAKSDLAIAARSLHSDKPTGAPTGLPVGNPLEGEGEVSTSSGKEHASAKTLFANCRFTDLEAVKSALPELASEGVNLEHYRDAIRNWSDTKDEKRSERGWLATFRQWTKTDRDKGELKMVAGVVKHKSTGWLRPQRA